MDSALRQLLPSNWVLPAYDSASLANLPSTVGTLLGVNEGWRSQPLPLSVDGKGVRQVVILLLDGVGYHRLQQQTAQDDGGLLDLLSRYGGGSQVGLSAITSVSPATTTVATSVLQANGASPAELGILGFSQRLPQLGLIANMLFWRPAWKEHARYGELEEWGYVPEKALPVPTIYQLLSAAGVRSTAFLPHEISHSPLSRLQCQGGAVTPYIGWMDMLTRLGAHLEATAGERSYSYAYLPDFDSLMHRDGPDSPSFSPLFTSFVPALRSLIDGLSPAARRGTLFLITADHGHVGTPPEQQLVLQRYPRIFEQMALREAGEPRHLYLYARAGASDELAAAAREELGRYFAVLGGPEALAAGLYGDPAYAHLEAERRIGDVVLLARGGASMWDEGLHGRLLSMHGALERDEMLVPLLALRADA